MEGFTMTAPAGEQQENNGGQGGGGQQTATGGTGGEQTLTQDHVNKLLASQKREIEGKYAGYEDLKDKATKYDALSATTKTDIERFQEQLNSATSENGTLKTDNERLQTQLARQQEAAKQGLDPELWDRVTGKTAEEIEADVKKLVEKFGAGTRSTTVIGPRSGSGASAPDGRTAKQRAAAGFRSLGSGQ
jgi:regulator of replication initiation timing